MKKKLLALYCFFWLAYVQCQASSHEMRDAFIIQNLANAKLSLLNGNYEEAYVNSKTALSLTKEDDEQLQEHLFVVLFEHIAACDQGGYFEERDMALQQLELMSEEIDFISNDFDCLTPDSLEAYQDLIQLSNLSANDQTKNKLATIASHLFLSHINKSQIPDISKNISHFKLQKLDKHKKIWKRSLGWWQKKIKKFLNKVNDWLELIDEVNKTRENLNRIQQGTEQ